MKRIIAMLLPLALFGCSQGGNEYSKELAAYLNLESSQLERYRGLAEYGYDLTLQSVEEAQSELRVTYRGVMNDGISDTGDRSFEAIYTVDESKMVLTIVQHTPNAEENLLHSLIGQQVVLQLPLEEGATWTQDFSFQEQTFSAQNQLNIIAQDQIEVQTKVQGMEWYCEETYLETRVYQKGVGLLSFQNLYDLNEQKDNPEMDCVEDYWFGYALQPKLD